MIAAPLVLSRFPVDSSATFWYVVPADDKQNAWLIVSQIVLDSFEGLKMTCPKTNAKRWQELQSIRKRLTK
jgi:hypothetical protein